MVTAKEFPTLEALLSPVFSPDGSRIAYTAILARVAAAAGAWPFRRRAAAPRPSSRMATRPVGRRTAARSPSCGSSRTASIPVATVSVGSDRTPHEIRPSAELNAPEWSPSGKWIAVSTFMGVTLASPDAKEDECARCQGSTRPALAWSKDSKTIYGLSYNSDPPALKALDVATGAVRTLAEYHLGFQPLPLIENSYTGSIRISLAPDGKSVAVGTATSQADLWILDGALK